MVSNLKIYDSNLGSFSKNSFILQEFIGAPSANRAVNKAEKYSYASGVSTLAEKNLI